MTDVGVLVDCDNESDGVYVAVGVACVALIVDSVQSTINETHYHFSSSKHTIRAYFERDGSSLSHILLFL